MMRTRLERRASLVLGTAAAPTAALRVRGRHASATRYTAPMLRRPLLLLALLPLACGDATATDTSTGTSSTTTSTTTTTDATTGTPTTSTSPSSDPTTGETTLPEATTTDASTTTATTTTTDAQTTTTASTGDPLDTPTLGGYPAWVHFTNPKTHAGHDPTILDEITRLINATPDDGTIRAAIHSLTVNTVADALLAAHARGVEIQIAEDGSDQFDADATPQAVHAALGEDHIFCGDGQEGKNYGCITTDASGIMHTKLYTFSRTEDPDGTVRDNVVWFGSANMTNATGANTFNNTVTIYGDLALFDHFNNYFDQLFSQSHYAGNNFYDAELGRGYFATDSARVYASPDQDGDLVRNRLNDIEPGDDCEIQVAEAMVHDSRPEIVDLLVALVQGGCQLQVIAGDIDAGSLAKFKTAGVAVRTNDLHDKLVIVAARFAGSPEVRHLVFTGSHNWTYSANYRNDEIFVRIESQPFHAAYVAHFDEAWTTGKPL